MIKKYTPGSSFSLIFVFYNISGSSNGLHGEPNSEINNDFIFFQEFNLLSLLISNLALFLKRIFAKINLRK